MAASRGPTTAPSRRARPAAPSSTRTAGSRRPPRPASRGLRHHEGPPRVELVAEPGDRRGAALAVGARVPDRLAKLPGPALEGEGEFARDRPGPDRAQALRRGLSRPAK